MDLSQKMEAVSFGSLVINGKTYTSDLMIFPDGRIRDKWWRQKGHRLLMEDIHDLVTAHPEVIVVGAGINGMMKPLKGLKKNLLEKGIELITLPNQKAMEVFNELTSKKRVGACFHLTC